jgi:hypothetical protein
MEAKQNIRTNHEQSRDIAARVIDPTEGSESAPWIPWI